MSEKVLGITGAILIVAVCYGVARWRITPSYPMIEIPKPFARLIFPFEKNQKRRDPIDIFMAAFSPIALVFVCCVALFSAKPDLTSLKSDLILLWNGTFFISAGIGSCIGAIIDLKIEWRDRRSKRSKFGIFKKIEFVIECLITVATLIVALFFLFQSIRYFFFVC